MALSVRPSLPFMCSLIRPLGRCLGKPHGNVYFITIVFWSLAKMIDCDCHYLLTLKTTQPDWNISYIKVMCTCSILYALDMD